ncbi:MAG: BLUF domain-containing protein [Rhodobacteraceae bacterium]|nr:BLUF domain-containing protein [Paracoccaceae bacterium]
MIYCSRVHQPDGSAIRDILASCERNNRRDHVTGMLLFTCDYFVQVLEGSRSSVNRRFLSSIAIDPRHSDIEIMASGTVDFRLFEKWSMQYVAMPRADDPRLTRFSAQGAFDPYAMSSAAIEQFCMSQMLHELHEAAPSRRVAEDQASSQACAGGR